MRGRRDTGNQIEHTQRTGTGRTYMGMRKHGKLDQKTHGTQETKRNTQNSPWHDSFAFQL